MMAMVKENQAKVVKKEEPVKSLLEQIKANIPRLKDQIAKKKVILCLSVCRTCNFLPTS